MSGRTGQHTTFRGTVIDIESLRNEQGDATAVGNMGVNGNGDRIKSGIVTKSAEQLARENYRQRVVEKTTSIKGPEPVEGKKPVTAKKSKEVELPNGDIVKGDE